MYIHIHIHVSIHIHMMRIDSVCIHIHMMSAKPPPRLAGFGVHPNLSFCFAMTCVMCGEYITICVNQSRGVSERVGKEP